jgi:uncharacterized Tic20 family protein
MAEGDPLTPQQPQTPSPQPGMPPPATPAPLGYSSGYPGPYAGPPPTSDDRTMAMLAHLLGILTAFIGPLIIWLMKKEQSPFVDDQGKEALNFQLTLLIGWVASVALSAVCIGFLLMPAVFICAIIFGILASVAANKGEAYRYPINIRFIK